MDRINILLTFLLICSAALNIFIAVRALVVKTAISKTFFFLCVSIALYSAGYAMELSSSQLEQLLMWNAVKYIGLPFIPAFWLIFSLQYTNREHLLLPGVKLAIFTIPVLTLVMRYTNSWHYLFYTSVTVVNEIFPVLYVEKGPWYLIHGVFMTFCVLFSCYLYYFQMKRSWGKLRYQCILIAFASVLPWLTFFLNVFNISPYAIDLGPIIGGLSCLLFFVALLKYEFLDLKPLARDQVFKCANDGLIALDAHFRIVDFNDAAANVIKNLQESSISKNIETVIQEDFIEAILSGKEIPYSVTDNGTDQHYILRNSEILDKKGNGVGFLITITDVTDYVFTMRYLEELASIDALTKTFNRRYFFECTMVELEKAREGKGSISLMIFDIDFFKRVNDEYGHQAGDAVLRNVSEICKGCIRSNDILGRYGGEEFVVFFPNTAPEEAVDIANRIKQTIENSETLCGGKSIKVTVSFGITGTRSLKDETIGCFFKAADNALYKAKTAGRNSIEVVPLPSSEET